MSILEVISGERVCKLNFSLPFPENSKIQWKTFSSGRILHLLFWPVFVIRYLLVENLNPAAVYHPVYCPVDDFIPFLEGFILPYILWYICIVGVHLWLFFRDDPVFVQYSRYLIVSMGISTAIYFLYPTCQNLRPETFPRDNLLTDGVRILYQLDTSTNVCPSEHVIGSIGFFLGIWYATGSGTKRRVVWATAAVLTAAATVFLKQHSVVDVIAAIPVCIAAWAVSFAGKGSRGK